jgi:lysophospholipase L1-like esterase
MRTCFWIAIRPTWRFLAGEAVTLSLSDLFVLGDSISIAYGPALERMLSGRFTYSRKGYALLGSQNLDSSLVNGGDSQCIRTFLQAESSQIGSDCFILLLNCGLHDLRVDPRSGAHQVELADYLLNLEQIIILARNLCQKVVWVRTTPVADVRHNRLSLEFHRYNADVIAYNAGADALMHKAGIPSLDLYRFTFSLCEKPDDLEHLYDDHVHFTSAVSQNQAAYLAGWLEAFNYAC